MGGESAEVYDSGRLSFLASCADQWIIAHSPISHAQAVRVFSGRVPPVCAHLRLNLSFVNKNNGGALGRRIAEGFTLDLDYWDGYENFVESSEKPATRLAAV